MGSPNQAWLDLDLLDTLAALAVGQAAAVHALLEEPLQLCPELLLCGMAAARGDWGPLQREVTRLWPSGGGAKARGVAVSGAVPHSCGTSDMLPI